jgi:protein-tyrosine phosphatase
MIIDLHSHILPEFDDGSHHIQMSQQMIEEAKKQGVQLLCSTSHYYADKESIEHFLARRQKKLDLLIQTGLSKSMPLVAGAEAAFFDGISKNEMSRQLCLGKTNTLLLEMPFDDWHAYQVQEVISLALDKHYQIILAHPERFLFSKGNERYLEKFASMRIGFQVNASTLLSFKSRRKGLQLLENCRMPLLGSDMHNTSSRPCQIAAARKVIEKKLGANFLKKMDDNAAKLLLEGETIDGKKFL